MRAALLPTPGHPFVVAYWLRNFVRVWRDEVDTLYVNVNGATERDLFPLFEQVPGDVRVTYTPYRVGHGEALAELLERCDADEVLLVEDDAYVRRPGSIATAFNMRLPGVVIGTPCGGYSPEIGEVARETWGQISEGYGLWPCFLFSERDTLRGVVDGFPSQTWRAGATVPGIERTFPVEMHTDTFSAAAFMLRARYPVVHVPQYKELWQKTLPDPEIENPPWFHAGGLSGHSADFGFMGDGYRPNLGGGEALDISHRVWWWTRCLDTAPLDLLPDTRERMKGEIRDMVEMTGIADHVAEWDEKLRPWITWDDNAR